MKIFCTWNWEHTFYFCLQDQLFVHARMSLPNYFYIWSWNTCCYLSQRGYLNNLKNLHVTGLNSEKFFFLWVLSNDSVHECNLGELWFLQIKDELLHLRKNVGSWICYVYSFRVISSWSWSFFLMNCIKFCWKTSKHFTTNCGKLCWNFIFIRAWKELFIFWSR